MSDREESHRVVFSLCLGPSALHLTLCFNANSSFMSSLLLTCATRQGSLCNLLVTAAARAKVECGKSDDLLPVVTMSTGVMLPEAPAKGHCGRIKTPKRPLKALSHVFERTSTRIVWWRAFHVSRQQDSAAEANAGLLGINIAQGAAASLDAVGTPNLVVFALPLRL